MVPQLIFIENLDDHSLVRRKALRQKWRNGTNVAGCTVVRNRSQVFERILGNLAVYRSDLTKKNVAAVQVFFEGKDISPDFLTWVRTKRT